MLVFLHVHVHVTYFADFIGFSVYVTSTQEIYPGNAVVGFGIVTNEGDAFSQDTSTFTCPTGAFYYIYFNLYYTVNPSGSNCQVGITKDGTVIVKVRIEAFYRYISLQTFVYRTLIVYMYVYVTWVYVRVCRLFADNDNCLVMS